MNLKLNDNLKSKIQRPNLKPDFSWVKKLDANVLWGILAYLHLLVVVPLLFRRKDEYARYHARQGLAVLAVWVIFGFSFFFPVVPWVIGFFLLILILAGLVNAITNKQRALPLIGKLAEKY